MPRWRKLCKEGEQPCQFIGMTKLQEELDCEHSIGWSEIPEEWLPAIKELVEKIRERWTVDGAGRLFLADKPEDIESVVRIAQIKDKFGSLRFYYDVVSNESGCDIYDEINKLIDECEERLAEDDPHYGVPY